MKLIIHRNGKRDPAILGEELKRALEMIKLHREIVCQRERRPAAEDWEWKVCEKYLKIYESYSNR